MTRIRVMLSAAFAIAALSAFAQPAQAEILYPWCAQLSENGAGGAYSCSFDTYEQCLQTVRGIGGYCEPNASYRAPASAQPHPARKRSNRN